MNDKLTAQQNEIVNLLKTIEEIKTCQGHGGELDDVKKLTIKLPAVLVWFDGEAYQKEGQTSYIRRPEFHAIVMTKNVAKESKRLATGLDLIDLVLDKLELVVHDLKATEPIENSKSYFIAAVKFIW